MTEFIIIRIFVLVCSYSCFGYCEHADLTRTYDSKGSDVVDAVINILRRSCIFPDDLLYLRRVAYIDTHDGTDPYTYVIRFHGGIWHIGESDFNKTMMDPYLQHYRDDISKSPLYIDWSTLTYGDLRNPLYSALATELSTILKTGNGSIPNTIAQQSAVWSNGGANRDTAHFGKAVEELEKRYPLKNNLDVVFVLDSSASMSEADFNQSKEFVRNYVLNVDIGLARVAVVQFSSHVFSSFDLNNNMSGSRLQDAISNIKYIPGGTNTYDALQYVHDNIFKLQNGSRSNAAKVVVLVTDGASSDNVATIKAAQALRTTGVTVFAVGVGPLIDKHELSLVVSDPVCVHLRTVDKYTDLTTAGHSSMQLAIQAPVMLAPGSYIFSCSSDVTAVVVASREPKTIEITTDDGALDLFGSGSPSYVPNSAIFSFNDTVTKMEPVDIYVRDGSRIILALSNASSGGCQSRYRINVKIGDHIRTGNYKICVQTGLVSRCNQNDLIDSPFIVRGTPDPAMPSVCSGSDSFTAAYPGKTDRYLMCNKGRLIVVFCQHGQRFDPVKEMCEETSTPTSTNDALTAILDAPTRKAKETVHIYSQVTPRITTRKADIATAATATKTTVATAAVVTLSATDPTSTERHVVSATEPNTTEKSAFELCTPEHISQGKLTWPTSADGRKYIVCVSVYSGTVRDCGEHKFYSPTVHNCLYKDLVANQNGTHDVIFDGVVNPCRTNVGSGQYYAYPGDPHKFIQCDAYGEGFVKMCGVNLSWNPTLFSCSPTLVG